MNLKKLFEIQSELDCYINNEYLVNGSEDRLSKKMLALQIKLGMLANEWRVVLSEGKEFRRNKVEGCPTCNGTGMASMGEGVKGIKICPDCKLLEGNYKEYNPLLEEYVDCLILLFSIGLELNFSDIDVWKVKESNITNQFIECFGTIYNIYFQKAVNGEVPNVMYEHLFAYFIGLGEMLGFTWEQIEQAYLEKINNCAKTLEG